MKKFNSVEINRINDVGTTFEVKYFDDGVLVDEQYSQCSFDEVICPFRGIKSQDSITRIADFGKDLVCKFYTNEEHFNINVGAFDYMLVSPKIPIKESGYSELYEGIYSRIKMMKDGVDSKTLESMSDEDRLNCIKRNEYFMTEECKKDYLVNFVSVMLNFELAREKANEFILDYMKQNPQFKYVRVFSN